MRSPYQRDRDRIVHASAFRRLTYKTQVFLFHEGDHYRTRLTHSIEVAQIARAIARQLGLEEDLAEALALAHDLGHPPFGHAGERALDAAMAEFGGFDHNAQSLRIVTELESRYADFDGLNLTWETLEGLVKHNGPLTGPHAGGRAVPGAIARYDRRHPLQLGRYASAEAQVAAIADDIAYTNHDIDDGLRAGLITLAEIRDVPRVGDFVRDVRRRHARLGDARVIYEVNRRLITVMIEDVIAEARRRLARLDARSADDVRAAAAPVAVFSETMAQDIADMRSFLFARVYRHRRVMRVMRNAEEIVRDLFARYTERPAELPERWRRPPGRLAKPAWRASRIADYVSGMTDRYAIGEHRRLFDATPDLR